MIGGSGDKMAKIFGGSEVVLPLGISPPRARDLWRESLEYFYRCAPVPSLFLSGTGFLVRPLSGS